MISASINKFSYCFAQPIGGFLQIFLVVTNAQTLSIELLEQFCDSDADIQMFGGVNLVGLEVQ